MYYYPFYGPGYGYGYGQPYSHHPFIYPANYMSTQLINSQISTVNQSIFNAGIMTGVTPVANSYNARRRY